MSAWTCRRCRMPATYPRRFCGACEASDLTLFPVDPPPPSLDELRLRDQQRLVLTGLMDLHARFPRGANAFELQAHLCHVDPNCRVERNAISSRFRELEAMGLVFAVEPRRAPTGKDEKCYEPTALAHAWRKRAVAA